MTKNQNYTEKSTRNDHHKLKMVLAHFGYVKMYLVFSMSYLAIEAVNIK